MNEALPALRWTPPEGPMGPRYLMRGTVPVGVSILHAPEGESGFIILGLLGGMRTAPTLMDAKRIAEGPR